MVKKIYLNLIYYIAIIVIAIACGYFFITGYQNLFTTEVRVVGGVHTEGIVGVPRFINPVLAQSNSDRDLTKLIYSSLLDVDTSGSVIYRLAEDIEISEDQKEYILTLNKDAYFSDGEPVTASDVVFTIDKIKSSQLKSPLFSKWSGISVEEINSHQISFKLSDSYSDFIYNLAIGILPEHIWKEISDEEFIFSKYNTIPVGSGSYAIKSVDFEKGGSPEQFHLISNKHAMQKPFIPELFIKIFENGDELLAAFLEEEIEGAYGISPSAISDIPEDMIHSGTLPRTFGIFFNTENNKSVLNKEVRKALSLAINREKIVQSVFSGYAQESDTPFGQKSKTKFDIEKSIELLEKDGWSLNDEGFYVKTISGNETPLSFTLSIPNLMELQEVAEIVRSSLEKIGVSVYIQDHDQNDLLNSVIRSRDYDALLFGYILEKPSDSYAFWHSTQRIDPGLNISLFNNIRADSLLSNIRSQQQRADDISGFLSIWEDEMPAIFLYTPKYIYLGSNRISIPKKIASSSDRFNMINRWYKETIHVWKFLIKK